MRVESFLNQAIRPLAEVKLTPLSPPLVRGETSSLPLVRGGLEKGQRYCCKRFIALKRVGSVVIASFLATTLVAPSDRTSAQITPDATLPTSVTGNPNFIITGGTQAGNNLFHSFREFSVPTGGSAFFDNALDVKNILSRVTGSSISSIDGKIQANGTANLFLLNPNGIIFGPNASLDIGGSFLGSTASSINFADGSQFRASNPQASPLLTVSVPIGLGFGSNPGAIRVQGTGHSLTIADASFAPFTRGDSNSGLRVNPGQTLALVGGDVSLEGGTLTAEAGRIELGSVARGVVSLSPSPVGWTLGYQGVRNFQDIQLSKQALADASGVSGGSIQLQGRNIELRDGSIVLIQNQGSQPAGSISVNASDSLKVDGTSPDVNITSGLNSESIGDGKAGNIEVSTRQLVLQNGGLIQRRTFSSVSSGSSGDIGVNVKASDSAQLVGVSPLNPTIVSSISDASFSSGNSGGISVSTGQLDVLNGASIVSSSFGTGDAGNVTVNASKSVQVIGFDPSIFLAQSNISSLTLREGNAGSVTINTARLAIRDGGTVASSTFASGSAGSITVNASKSVEVSGTVPGSINPSGIASSATLLDAVTRQALGLPDKPSGDSGDVTINTRQLKVTDGALINVRNDGTGTAGRIVVNAHSILLDNKAAITARSGESGEGENEANITLNVRDALILRRNSQISAEASGEQRGGNITINAGAIAAVPGEDSDITASAPGGTGGRITINAQGIFGLQVSPTLTPKNDITAFGKTPELNGTVQINTPEINLQGALNQLNGNFVTPEQAIASSCLARRNAQQGSFTVTGTGGLPYTPYDAVRGQYAVSSVQGLGGQEGQEGQGGQGGISSAISLPSQQASNPKSWKLGDPIQEAQGMMQTADGRVIVGTAPELVRVAQAKNIICDADEPSTPK